MSLTELKDQHTLVNGVLSDIDRRLQRRRPRVLHHYTTSAGFQGIVKTGSLFLTDALFLNDQSELVYGRGVVEEALKQLIEREDDEAWKTILTAAAAYYHEGAPQNLLRFFVASFCTDGNLLSQWRAYAAPGSGYAVGFTSRKLANAKLALNESLTAKLRPVLYRRERQLALMTNLVDALKRKCGGECRKSPQHAKAAFQILLMAVTALLPIVKHPVFSEEHEWRLTVLTVGDQARTYLQFRTTARQLIPYLVLDLRPTTKNGRLPLESVTHAPVEEPDLRKKVTRDLLQAHGYSEGEVDVRGSDIPLRLL